MLFLLLIMLGTTIFCGFIIGLTPIISRKEMVFGVILPEKSLEEPIVKKSKKAYFLVVFLLSLIICIPMFFFLHGNDESGMNGLAIYSSVALILFCVVSYFIYFYYRKKIMAFKKTIPYTFIEEQQQAIVVSTTFDRGQTIVSNGWMVGINLVLILATILLPVIFYGQIPAQVPTHWGTDGVNAVTDKSIGLFMQMPFIQLILLVVMVVVNYSIKITKQRLDPDNPEKSKRQNIAFRRAMSRMIFWIAIASSLMFLVIQAMMVFNIHSTWMVWVATGIILIPSIGGSIYIMMRYGQGGQRLKSKGNHSSGEKQTVNGYDDDKNWIGGLIYYNPNDPALWVEKRFGLGMTINMGIPKGKWLAIGTLVLIVLLTVIPFLLR